MPFASERIKTVVGGWRRGAERLDGRARRLRRHLILPAGSEEAEGYGKKSWVLFVDLVKAFDSVLRNVLFAVLVKFGVPPHLTSVIKRMNKEFRPQR